MAERKREGTRRRWLGKAAAAPLVAGMAPAATARAVVTPEAPSPLLAVNYVLREVAQATGATVEFELTARAVLFTAVQVHQGREFAASAQLTAANWNNLAAVQEAARILTDCMYAVMRLR